MPANPKIFITDPSMLGSKLFDALPMVKSFNSIEDEAGAQGILLETPWGKVKISFIAEDALTAEIEALEGFIESKLASNEDQQMYVMTRTYYLQMALDLEISQNEKNDDDLHNFLFEFNSALNGIMFLYDSIWDYDTSPICGPHFDEAEFPEEKEA
mgnify:FL=1